MRPEIPDRDVLRAAIRLRSACATAQDPIAEHDAGEQSVPAVVEELRRVLDDYLAEAGRATHPKPSTRLATPRATRL